MPLVVIQVTFEKFTINKLQDKTTKYRLSPVGVLVDRENSNSFTDDRSRCQFCGSINTAIRNMINHLTQSTVYACDGN